MQYLSVSRRCVVVKSTSFITVAPNARNKEDRNLIGRPLVRRIAIQNSLRWGAVARGLVGVFS